jgi:hypothetical protein
MICCRRPTTMWSGRPTTVSSTGRTPITPTHHAHQPNTIHQPPFPTYHLRVDRPSPSHV